MGGDGSGRKPDMAKRILEGFKSPAPMNNVAQQFQPLTPIATDMFLPNHSGIHKLDAPVHIYGKTTAAVADKYLRIFSDGTETCWIGDYLSGFTGFINPNTNGGTIFFGLSKDDFSDTDAIVTCGPTNLALIGPTSITFGTSIFNTELTMTDNTFTFQNSQTLGWATSGELQFNCNLSIETAGKGIDIKEGSNARMGTDTLSAGFAQVATTAVTTNSRIFCQVTTADSSGGKAFCLVAENIVNGTSFDVVARGDTGTQTSSDSSFNWIIFNPA